MASSIERPNVIFLMTDALRATALGLYGNPDVRTPHLERMADEGQLFEWTYCPNPSCVPSRCAVLTGRYPHTCRSRVNFVLLQPDERTFPEEMREGGLRAGPLGQEPRLPVRRSQLAARGLRLGVRGQPHRTGGTQPRTRRSSPTSASCARCSWTTSSTRRALVPGDDAFPPGDLQYLPDGGGSAQLPAGPPKNHSSCTARFPSRTRPTPRPNRTPACTTRRRSSLPGNYHDDLTEKPSYQQVTQVVQRMDTEPGGARASGPGHVLRHDPLHRRPGGATPGLPPRRPAWPSGRWSYSRADHGEYVGEHGMISKANQLYDSLMRVPLIVWWPGAIEGGRRVDYLHGADRPGTDHSWSSAECRSPPVRRPAVLPACCAAGTTSPARSSSPRAAWRASPPTWRSPGN